MKLTIEATVSGMMYQKPSVPPENDLTVHLRDAHQNNKYIKNKKVQNHPTEWFVKIKGLWPFVGLHISKALAVVLDKVAYLDSKHAEDIDYLMDCDPLIQSVVVSP